MPPLPPPRHPELDAARASSLASISRACLHREYPNVTLHVVESDADAQTPRQMKPAFYGCLDWHSAVHNHWALVRLARMFPEFAGRGETLAAVGKSFTEENIREELKFLTQPRNGGFEVPYGMAWFLQLARELRFAAELPQGAEWSRRLAPIETLARDRMAGWLRRIPVPIRVGEHSQSAFAMGLMWDFARDVGDKELRDLVAARGEEFHAGDIGWPFRFEPSAYDFLSPGLAAADLLRRVWEPVRFTNWLMRYLGEWDDDSVRPVVSADSASGKLSHWDGLNLSRAWMLDGIAGSCLDADLRVRLLGQARRHLLSGLPEVRETFYAGAHWLVSFAVYALSGSGLGELR